MAYVRVWIFGFVLAKYDILFSWERKTCDSHEQKIQCLQRQKKLKQKTIKLKAMKLVMAALNIQNYTKMDRISDIIKSFAVKKVDK